MLNKIQQHQIYHRDMEKLKTPSEALRVLCDAVVKNIYVNQGE